MKTGWLGLRIKTCQMTTTSDGVVECWREG